MKEFFLAYPVILIVIAAAAWFAVQFLMSILVRPYRDKLHSGLMFIAANSDLTDREKNFLDHLWNTSISAKSTFMLCLSYLLGMAMSKEAILLEKNDIEEHSPNFWADKKVRDLMGWYFVSIFVANPIFGVVSIFLRVLWRIKLAWVFRDNGDDDASNHNLSLIPAIETAAKV